jgi:hypothetical protein
MSPTLDFIDIGDVLNSPITRDTITAIDSATDTCTLANAGSALIFYH